MEVVAEFIAVLRLPPRAAPAFTTTFCEPLKLLAAVQAKDTFSHDKVGDRNVDAGSTRSSDGPIFVSV